MTSLCLCYYDCMLVGGHVMSCDVVMLMTKVNVVTLTVCSGNATGEQLCDILEAVFLHELKNKVSTFLPFPISFILLSSSFPNWLCEAKRD